MHQESKKLKLMDDGESDKPKCELRETEKSYDSLSEVMLCDKISGGSNDPQKKKKKHKERTYQSLDVIITKHFTRRKAPPDDLKIVPDSHESGISLKKDKRDKSNVEQEYSGTADDNMQNQQQNHSHKKKKKKREKALDQLATEDCMKSEVYVDHVEKSKKKKREVTAENEEDAFILQGQMNVADSPEKHISDLVLKKYKKHKKHKKLKKGKHGENVAVTESTQLSFFMDNNLPEIVKIPKDDQHNELEVHREFKKEKPATVTEDMHSPCESENNTFKKSKKHKKKNRTHHYSAEEKLSDSDYSVVVNLINRDKPLRSSTPTSIKQSVNGSPQKNTNKHRNESMDGSAIPESVSDDTFTLEVHEDDTYSILNDTICSDDVTEVRPYSKKQYYSDDNSEDTTVNDSKENQNCVDSEEDVNVQQKVKDISVKTVPPKKERLSFKKVLRVKDKSQLEESCNSTMIELTVPWAVPQLHLIETRVCGRPTKEQRTKMEALGEEIKSGKFNKKEDDQIKKNWRKFCRVYNLSDKDPTRFMNVAQPGGSMFLSARERINFVRFLAHELNNRPLYAVYKRFQRLFLADKIVRGKFSAKEDKIIRRYMEYTTSRTPFANLARILNRDRLAVEKRCQTLECNTGNGDEYVKWERENIEKLVKHLLEITGSNSLNDLKDREIERQEWKALSEKLNICKTKLRRAWFYTIYPRLFISNKILTNEIKLSLIKRLIEKNEGDWRAVDWEQIAKDFGGFTGVQLNKLMKNVVYYHVPRDMRSNLGDCLQYLKKLVSEKKTFTKRKLKKIKINEALLRNEG